MQYMDIVEINKFDAIRAQLDAAIELYFISDNIVATHTLTAAAYNLLKDIAKHEGVEYPFLKSGYIQSLPDEQQKTTMRFLNEPENFFKHADRDSYEVLSFNSELTEIMLMDACSYFKNSTESPPKYYDAFKVWVGRIKDSSSIDDETAKLIELFRDALKAKGKKEFWNIVSKHLTNKSKGTR